MAAFVARISPIVDAFEVVEGILTWRDSAKTWLALGICLSICTFPISLTILPHVLILWMLWSSYVEKARYEHIIRSKASGDASVLSYSNANHSVAASLPSMSNTSSTSETATTAAVTQSATYLRNMQFIQNQMGLFVVGYDTIESGLRSLHQYADNNPIQVLQILGISSILAALTWIYIPPTALAVLGVITVFFFNTAFFQALITTLPARIYKNITTRVDVVWEGIQAASLYPEGSIVVVTLWENQRWWAGLGWIPHLFGSERSPWSDESGKIPRPQKDVYALPSDGNGVGTWSWLDSEWSLDFDWTTSGVDQKEGWQYCDHRWEHPRSKLGIGSITRRRAWVRRMRFVPNIGVVVAASLLPKKTPEDLGAEASTNEKKLN